MGKTGTKYNLLLSYFKQEVKEALYLNHKKSCLKQELILRSYLTLFIKRKIHKCC